MENGKQKTVFRSIVVGGLIFAVGIVVFLNLRTNNGPYMQGVFNFQNVSVSVDIVRTEAEMAKGLGDRRSLPEGRGMFFEFPVLGPWPIWMKDMYFPIDIIWLDQKMKVVSLKENATPESFPEIFRSEQNSLYVLEVPAGFVRKWGLTVGESGFLK